MKLDLDSRSLAVLFVRVSLALYLGAAGLALLTGNTGTEPVWLPLDTFSPIASVLGVFCVAAAALLLVGRTTTAAAIATAAMLTAVLVAWLLVNPLHNTMNHLMPFMAATLVTLAFTPGGRRLDETTRASLVLLFARLFVGSIFVAQGTRSVVKAGLVGFARKLYVAPLADSWVPEPLLWVAGVTNPVIQIGTGILLILGLRTRFAAALMAAFLVSIFFGHLLMDPFDRGDSVHAYAMANFLIAIVVLWLHPRGDRFSVDALLARRGRGAVATAAATLLLLGGCASAQGDVNALVAEAERHMGSQRFESVPRAVAEQRTRAALARALKADATAPGALRMQALVQLHFDLDREAALRSFERAVAAAPNDAQIRFEYAQLLGALGRFDEALAESARAEELEPQLRLQSGRLLYMAGRYEEILSRFATPPAERRASAITHFYRGLALEQLGRANEAVREHELAVELLDQDPGALGALARTYALTGRRDDATRILDALAARRTARLHVVAYQIAAAYEAAGDHARADEALRQAYEDRDRWLMWIDVDPRWARLRGAAGAKFTGTRQTRSISGKPSTGVLPYKEIS
ncbi:MAG TPA: tetratricopeptide repeat protein [Thermoanaerobaculia bacterium]|jgi:uncharacterized membrane protein YphA (DoxX/SURF4 family)/tetratricopeptide (TPR) repeat protein